MTKRDACFTPFLLVGLFFLFAGVASGENRNFELIGHIGGEYADSVVTEGTIAYVVGTHLWLLDITVPERITEIGELGLDIPGVTEIAVSGPLLYVLEQARWGLGKGRIIAIDVSTPSKPIILSSTDTPYNSRDVFASGTLAFVTANDSGLLIYDFVNPLAPKLIGRANTTGAKTEDVFVQDMIAYVSDRASGFEIFDVSNPREPKVLGEYTDYKEMGDVCVVGETAYILARLKSGYTDVFESFLSVDVSVPERPILRKRLDVIGKKLSVDGSFAVVGGDTLNAIDVRNPADPILKKPGNPIRVSDLSLDGGLVVANVNGGVAIFTMEAYRRMLGFFDLAFTATAVLVSSQTAFLAERFGLQVVDVTDPSKPRRGLFFAWWFDYVGPTEMYATGESLFIQNEQVQVLVADISNPIEPKQVGAYGPNGPANGISGIGNQILIPKEDGSLQIINASNPRAPILLGIYRAEGRCFSTVRATGSIAYIGESLSPNALRGGLRIIDISKPTEPRLLGVYERDGLSVSNVEEEEGVCYFLGGQSYSGVGLQIVDVSSPEQPMWRGAYGLDASSGYASLSISGLIAFALSGSPTSILSAIHTADPTTPIEMGEYETGSTGYPYLGLWSEGSIVYVAGQPGFQILRFTGPGAEPTPTPTMSSTPNGSASPTPTLSSTETPTPTSTGVPGETPTPTETAQPCEPTSDMNGDGVVDAFDLAIFMSHWHGAP